MHPFFGHYKRVKNVSMDRLWAPWRMRYMLGEAAAEQSDFPAVDLLPGATADCFLCEAAGLPCATETHSADSDFVEITNPDRQRLIIRRQTHTVTLLNRYPYNNGHLLISPRQHKASLEELTAEEQLEISNGLREYTALLSECIQPEGFNIGLNLGRAAGAGIPGHLHWHIVPRWTADSNFMSVTADARVISQSLDELWMLLTTAEQKSS